jgi:hypothetical protein
MKLNIKLNVNSLLVVAALISAGPAAQASKARLDALQSAPHLSDVLDPVGYKGNAKPDQSLSGEWAHIEWGGPDTNSGTAITAGNPHAEGGVNRMIGADTSMGFYIGRKSQVVTDMLQLATGSFENAQNPLNLWYAKKVNDYSWGLGLYYVNNEQKKISTAATRVDDKVNLMGLTASAASVGKWDFQANLGLGAKTSYSDAVAGVATTSHEFEGKMNVGVSGGYWTSPNLYIDGGVRFAGAKESQAGTQITDWDITTYNVGATFSEKKDNNEFFYGASLQSATAKNKEGAGSKVETMYLPVLVGMEMEATSWMVLRGSVSQRVLINSRKVSSGSTDVQDTAADSTTVGAGVGFKFGKLGVDGTFTNTTTGRFGLDNAGFMSQVAMTYRM